MQERRGRFPKPGKKERRKKKRDEMYKSSHDKGGKQLEILARERIGKDRPEKKGGERAPSFSHSREGGVGCRESETRGEEAWMPRCGSGPREGREAATYYTDNGNIKKLSAREERKGKKGFWRRGKEKKRVSVRVKKEKENGVLH